MNLRTLIVTLLAAGAAWAADATTPPKIDAKAAFERLKGLAGEWAGDSSMGKASVTYELIGEGSVVAERETMAAHSSPMLTMYHLDGDRLILTHYCMAGNQPRMQARAFDPKTGELRFEFLDATNLKDQGAGHMHNATIRLIDGQNMTADWEFYSGGKRSSTESIKYTRVR